MMKGISCARITTIASAIALAACSASPTQPPPPVVTPMPGVAVVTWNPTTMSTDGKPITDLRGYIVEYRQASGSPKSLSTAATRAVIPLPAGDWSFNVRSVSTSLGESERSADVSKAIP